MGIAQPGGFAEANAVDQARVVQGIADNGIPLVQQGFEQSAVGVEAGAIEDGVFSAEEGADRRFEGFVQSLRSADESHGRHTIPEFSESVGGRLPHIRMIRQPEVIVRAEIDDVPLCHLNLGALRAQDLPFGLVETGGTDLRQLLFGGCFERGVGHLPRER